MRFILAAVVALGVTGTAGEASAGFAEAMAAYRVADYRTAYEEFLPLTDIEKQLPQVFEHFFTSPDHRTCKRCGAVMDRPG